MNFEQKTIKYKGKTVFEKIKMPHFKRIPKLYLENEACFMFINGGAFLVRTQDELLSFSTGDALLAKCFDYFFEMSDRQKKETGSIELVSVLLHQNIVAEIFQFDISAYRHCVNFNAKKYEVNKLFEHYKNSIDILLENPELADETMIKTKLKEFIKL